MIVVDSNIVVYLHIPGEHTPAAIALRQSHPDWAVPMLWRSEFRNVLAGSLRRKALTFEQVCALAGEAEDLLAEAEFEVESSDVLKLVRDSSCTAYDCEFIALARQLGAKLVTMDGKLLRAFPDDAVPLNAA